MKSNKMKCNNMKRLCIMISFILVLMATACSSNSKGQQEDDIAIKNTQEIEDNENTVIQDDSEVQSQLNQDTTADSDKLLRKTDEVEIEPIANKEISIYTMNETTLDVEVVVALVPKDTEITPELIVEKVVDSLSDRLVMVGIEEVTTIDDSVVVSFLSNQPPLTNVDKDTEATILNAIAQSLVDNLENYSKVIFRVEGKAYASDNFEYGIDEVYLENK